MKNNPLGCWNAKLPSATFVTRVATRTSASHGGYGKLPNKATVCHSERRKSRSGFRSRSFVEGVSRRRRSDTKLRSNATKGYGNEFGWLASANVTFTTKSHRNFKPYPASAKMPRAFAPLFHSAKVRLRAPRSAQNDIQRYRVIK